MNDYGEWISGPGACVPQGRHRLILTGTGLFLVLAIVAGSIVGTRIVKRRQRTPKAPDAIDESRTDVLV